MQPFKALSTAEQLAEYIQQGIVRGVWGDSMPGIRKLAKTLGVSSNTVNAALELMKKKDLLIPQGQGRRTRVVLPRESVKKIFRVAILPYECLDVELDYVVEIQRRLKEAGHEVSIAGKSLVGLGMKVERVARMVSGMEADAWLVLSAPQMILEWFVKHELPVFALFGRFRQLPVPGAGLNKIPAFRAAIRRLVELGHRRIVLLQPDHNRKPTPALLVRESLAEMEAHGIKTGPYNVPDWEQSPAGLRKCLDSLFAVSAPTAIIFDRHQELICAQIYLAHKKIFAPRDVSLISDDDPLFEWCSPSISCISWQSHAWVRQVMSWVDCLVKGKVYLQKRFNQAKFVEKDSIGPAL
ncbi:MAG: hypothetical protein RI957_587 [Verrucomicrobiota bacterium]|jgi:DNA-binding LacI/PurR family transcriptional regulator